MTNRSVLTDEEIITIGHQARAIEGGVDGYILPDLIGNLAELPEHIQKTIRAYGRAYGAVCYRAALQSEQVQALKRDKERLDWLADPKNQLCEVRLPRVCVERNPHSFLISMFPAQWLTKFCMY